MQTYDHFFKVQNKFVILCFGMKIFEITFLLFIIIACKPTENSHENHQSGNPSKEKKLINAPEFSADSAYEWIKKQLSFGPRVPGTNAHQKCREWLVQKFKSYGAEVHVQKAKIKTYNGREIEISNIIARYGVEKPKRVMLSAHWDTRPFADEDSVRQSEPILGANDAASGVAILIEMARHLQNQSTHIGIDIFLWDAEDMGNSEVEDSYCLGSQYWAKNIYPPNYRAVYGINLDMVGAKNAQFPQEGISQKYAQGILDKVWQTAHQIGYGAYFIYQVSAPITDDHYYINKIAGIPMIDIIHKDITKDHFFEQWHTHGDNLDVIDKNTLKAVGQTLLQVIYNEPTEL